MHLDLVHDLPWSELSRLQFLESFSSIRPSVAHFSLPSSACCGKVIYLQQHQVTSTPSLPSPL
jgi:hypothetical protein